MPYPAAYWNTHLFFLGYTKGSQGPLILSLVANPGPHETPFRFPCHLNTSLSSLLPEHRDFVPRCPFFYSWDFKKHL